MVTNGSQTVTSGQETEAFGRSIGTTGSPASPFGYHGAAGYRSDGDGPAGLEPYQKVGARYYDATFGRFITRDTDLSQSPYGYCDGDPVNCTDPSGHDAIDDAIAKQMQQWQQQQQQQLDQQFQQQMTQQAQQNSDNLLASTLTQMGSGTSGSGLAGAGGGAPAGAGGTPGKGGGGQKSTGTFKVVVTLPSTAMPHTTYDITATSKSGWGLGTTIIDGKVHQVTVIGVGNF